MYTLMLASAAFWLDHTWWQLAVLFVFGSPRNLFNTAFTNAGKINQFANIASKIHYDFPRVSAQLRFFAGRVVAFDDQGLVYSVPTSSHSPLCVAKP